MEEVESINVENYHHHHYGFVIVGMDDNPIIFVEGNDNPFEKKISETRNKKRVDNHHENDDLCNDKNNCIIGDIITKENKNYKQHVFWIKFHFTGQNNTI